MATPFLISLRKLFDGFTISVFCRSYVSEIFMRHSAVDDLIVCDSRNPLKVASTLHSRRPKNGWSYSFVLPNSFFSALVSFMSGAKERIGYGAEMRDLLLSKSLDGGKRRDMHLSRIYMHILESAVVGEIVDIPTPVVVPPYNWRKISSEFVGGLNYIVVAPGAAYGDAKRWPLERFREVAARIAGERGWSIVVVGSKEEREAVDHAFENVGENWINLAGKTGVAELLSVVRGASLLIGNDSGVSHISSAMGIPTVSIFGSTSPSWTVPIGPYSLCIYRGIPCSPCFERRCPKGEPVCLTQIGVDEVLKASTALLDEKESVNERR